MIALLLMLAPSFYVTDSSLVEGQKGSITILKSAKASSYSKVTLTVTPGTAKPGIDYVNIPTYSFTFGNNQLSQVVPVTTIDNSVVDGNRSFTYRITVQRYGTVTKGTGAVQITDNDVAAKWTHCAYENEPCNVVGTANVRYGTGTTWTQPRVVTNTITCSNATWGDPLPGAGKECQTDGTPGTNVPPPPPPPPSNTTNWVPAPLTVGGYACNRLQENTPNIGPCGSSIVFRLTDTMMSGGPVPVSMFTTVFYQDASGNFPVNSAYDVNFVGYWPASDLKGIAPSP